MRGVLGITVPDQTMIDILKRLEFTVDVQADGSWDVSAPLYREDVESFPTWPRKSSVSTAMTTSYPPS